MGEAPPYAEAAEFVADLDVLHRSLTANGSATLARGRLRSLRRAVDVFGFHLAGIDLRQNSDVHERTVGELLEVACAGHRAMPGSPRAARVAAAARGARDRAAAGLAVPALLRGDGLGAGDPARSRRGASALRQAPRCPTT